METERENKQEEPRGPQLANALAALRSRYFELYSTDMGAPRLVAQEFWDRLIAWARSSIPGRHPKSITRKLLRTLVQAKHSTSDSSVDKGLLTLAENLAILGYPRSKFTEGWPRGRFQKPRARQVNVDECTFEINGSRWLIEIIGPTGKDRGDDTRDALYLVPVLARASVRTPTTPQTAATPVERETPGPLPDDVWLDRMESIPTTNGYSKIFARCRVFKYAFTPEESEFICDAAPPVLRELAERGWLSLDPMTGRYSVPPTSRRLVAALDDDEQEVIYLLHAAYFALLLFAQSYRPVPWFLQVDLLHAADAKAYLVNTLDVELQDDSSALEEPTRSRTVSLLSQVARRLARSGFAEEACKVHAALGQIAGLLADRPLFERVYVAFEHVSAGLDEEARAAMRSFFARALGSLSTDELSNVGWVTSGGEEIQGF